MSQEEFCSAYDIPIATLKAWERRTAEPTAAEAAYIRLIARDPERSKVREPV